MTILTGKPQFLRDCKPGDLIRLPHLGASTWAIAAAPENAPDDVSCYVAINSADPGSIYKGAANPGVLAVLCFGSDYRIDARHDDNGGIIAAGGRTQGRIVCCLPVNGEPGSYLVCHDDLGNDKWLNVETGLLRSRGGGAEIEFASWELTLDDNRAPARVVHRHNWP